MVLFSCCHHQQENQAADHLYSRLVGSNPGHGTLQRPKSVGLHPKTLTVVDLRLFRDPQGRLLLFLVRRGANFRAKIKGFTPDRVLASLAEPSLLHRSSDIYAALSRASQDLVVGQFESRTDQLPEKPGYRWTLQELAARSGISRSAFALRFKEKAGISAMEYLTHWRTVPAADRLVNSRNSVLTIAFSLGYESESAFGFPFKPEMGCSPRQYCRTRVHDSQELLFHGNRRELGMGPRELNPRD